MRKGLIGLTVGAVAAIAVVAVASELPDYLTGPKDTDPVLQKQELVLVDIPEPAGEAVVLFNGKDLDDWSGWLGYADPKMTAWVNPTYDKERPIGAGGIGTIFTVVTEDGAPALRIDGGTWGSLMHKGDYSAYHLTLEYKLSGKRYAPRLNEPEDSGLMYHSFGSQGQVGGTWAKAAEFEIMPGSTGRLVPVGAGVGINTTIARDETLDGFQRRFMVGGRKVQAHGSGRLWNVEPHAPNEYPTGQWNRIDLYVFDDHAIHVVNGRPVLEATDMCGVTSASGRCHPMTNGHIQLEARGAEVFFRNIVLTPIRTMPKIDVLPPRNCGAAGC